MDAEDDKKRHRDRRLWQGTLAANAFAFALYLLMAGVNAVLRKTTLYWNGLDWHNIYFMWGLSAFTVIPVAMGVVCMRYWYELDLRPGKAYLYSMGVLLLSVMGAVFALHEGAICIIMALPLVALMMLLGIYFGHLIMQARDGRLRVSVLPLLAMLVVCDALSPHHYTNAVTDMVIIHAPAAKVWPYLAGYPAIQEKPDYWLWRIGLPCPTQSVADRAAVGAARECRFTDGVTIGERITDVTPGKRFAFDITRQPNNPEIMGHFVLKRGAFELHDNENGTCTLSGTSWYALNVYPSWYYDLWTQDIVRHVHLRVMRHIRMLAESGQFKVATRRGMK